MQEQAADHSSQDQIGTVFVSSSSIAFSADVCDPGVGGDKQPEGVADPTPGAAALLAGFDSLVVSNESSSCKGRVVTSFCLCLMPKQV